MLLLPITLSTAAACAAINLWLAARIVPRRMRGQVLTGDGGDPMLLAAMRAHANFAEYAPFVLILFGAIELAGGSPLWLQVAAVAFVAARIAHPFGMARGTVNVLRAGGILTTWVVLALLAGWAVALVYQGTTAATPIVFEHPAAPPVD